MKQNCGSMLASRLPDGDLRATVTTAYTQAHGRKVYSKQRVPMPTATVSTVAKHSQHILGQLQQESQV